MIDHWSLISQYGILVNLTTDCKFCVRILQYAWACVNFVPNLCCLLKYLHSNRVGKCHGYGGYIRVKKLEGWGKKSGRTHSFAKSSIVLGKFEQLIWNSVFKPGLYDRMFSFCSTEVAFCDNFSLLCAKFVATYALFLG